MVDKHTTLALNDDGMETLDETIFLAGGAEARGLPGFCGLSV